MIETFSSFNLRISVEFLSAAGSMGGVEISDQMRGFVYRYQIAIPMVIFGITSSIVKS